MHYDEFQEPKFECKAIVIVREDGGASFSALLNSEDGDHLYDSESLEEVINTCLQFDGVGPDTPFYFK